MLGITSFLSIFTIYALLWEATWFFLVYLSYFVAGALGALLALAATFASVGGLGLLLPRLFHGGEKQQKLKATDSSDDKGMPLLRKLVIFVAGWTTFICFVLEVWSLSLWSASPQEPSLKAFLWACLDSYLAALFWGGGSIVVLGLLCAIGKLGVTLYGFVQRKKKSLRDEEKTTAVGRDTAPVTARRTRSGVEQPATGIKAHTPPATVVRPQTQAGALEAPGHSEKPAAAR